MASAATNTTSKELQLFTAAREGNRPALQTLLEDGATAIDLESKHGDNEQTALIVAAAEGHVECLSDLLNAGANVEGVDKNASSPMMYACWKHHEACGLALLVAGADARASSCNEGMTALHNVAVGGEEACVSAQLAAGAVVEA